MQIIVLVYQWGIAAVLFLQDLVQYLAMFVEWKA